MKAEGLILRTRVQYHILTNGQHEMLRKECGLPSEDSYRFVVYERISQVSGALSAALKEDHQNPTVDQRAQRS